jgi:asparagine synthase (glutamine-hydrolysing)
MIFGCFTLAYGVVPDVNHLYPESGFGELSVHEIAVEGFKGGFLLHPGLPYRESDFYYYDKTGDILVLLSGIVYNKNELICQLGYKDDITDPELFARLFISEGPRFAERVNGDFTVFIARPSKREAHLIRDQLGIRPLAWTADISSLSFSSDMFGLCRTQSSNETLVRDFLLGFFKYIDFRTLPVPSVTKLLPGHILSYSSDGLKITKYWFPEKIRKDRSLKYDTMISQLRDLLLDAVRIRSDMRFHAGVHVSSGLDSGIVSVLARNEYGHQSVFHGFSWSPDEFVPPEVKFDEREIIREGCRKADIIPVFSDLKPEEFARVVSNFYFNRGFYNEDITIRQARARGVNLLFSGWGGDEFISTGDRGIEIDLLRHLRFGMYFRRNPIRPFRKFAKNQLNFVVYPFLGILNRDTAKAFDNETRYVRKPYKRSDRKAISRFYFHRSRRQMHLRMLSFYHLQDRCEIWAVNGFRKGIEYRYPLLDRRIIEFMIKVPTELLCKKQIFRPVLRELGEGIMPDEIRMHMEKKDHVYREFLDSVYSEAADTFIEEIEEWNSNNGLSFLDFDLLRIDSDRYISGKSGLNRKLFARALALIKGVHEFAKYYRG